MKPNTANIAGHRYRFSRTLRASLPLLAATASFALALAFAPAPAARAQTTTTVINSSTSINMTRQAVATGTNLVYTIGDGATLTITSTQASGAGAFNITGGNVTIGPATPGGSGWTVFSHITGTQSNGTAVQGGAIAMTGGTLTLANVTFDSNLASGNGAAIRPQSSAVIVTNGVFLNNVAFVSGGAIQNATGNITLTNVTFTGNRAANAGGAINEAQAGSPVTMTNVTFQDNYAGNQGGAISGNAGSPLSFIYNADNGATDYRITGNAAGGATITDFSTLAGATPPFTPVAASGGFYNVNGGAAEFNIASGVTLTIGDASDATHARDSIVSAAATAILTKSGNGLMVLNADNSHYAGAFNVNAGALMLGNSQAVLGGIINVAAGATLGGEGSFFTLNQASAPIASSVTLAPGATLDIGASSEAAGTLTFTNLSFSGATLKFDLFGLVDGAYSSDQLFVTGSLDPASNGTLSFGNFASGTYDLGNIGALASNLTFPVSGGARQNASLSVDGAELVLVALADQSRNLVWTGGADTVFGPSAGSWTDGAAINEFAPGDKVTFDNTAPAASRAITIGDDSVNVSEMTVAGDGYTFTGNGGINASARYIVPADDPAATLTATGKLIKTGAGTLTFADGANNFEGGIDISGGVIAFDNGNQLGAKDRAGVDHGINFFDTGTLRANADITGGLTTNITIASGKTAAFDTNGFDVAYAGAITLAGASGTFSKVGAGTLLFAGNTPAGLATDISAGALLLNSGNSSLAGLVTVRSGATFGGAGNAASVTLASGATLQVGANGAGALNIANLAFNGDATLTGTGVLSGAATLASGATLTAAVDDGMQITLAGSLTGDGALVKTGAGSLGLASGANLSVNTVSVNQGAFLLGGGNLSASSAITIGASGTLGGAGTVSAAAFANNGVLCVGNASGQASYGKLTIAGGSYTSNNGTVFLNAGLAGTTVQYDQLVLSGLKISGVTALVINTGTTLLRATQLTSIAPVDTTGATFAPGAFIGTPAGQGVQVMDSGYLYGYTPAGGWQPQGFVPFVGMEAAALLLGQATMDSVTNHLLALRDMASEPRARLWANWIAHRDTIDAKFYNNSNATTQGVQIGADWGNAGSDADESLAAGVFYDYAATNMSVASTTSNALARTNGFGAYFTYQAGWFFVDGVYHRSFEKYDTNTAYGNVSAGGRSWAASAEAGLTPSRPNWIVKVEPFFQWTYQTHAIGWATDSNGRIYKTDDINSSILRAGVRFWQEYKFADDVIIRPYLRGSWACEQDAKTRMTVADMNAPNAGSGDKVAGIPVTNDLGGSGGIIDAGVTVQCSRHFSLYGAVARNFIGNIKSYNANLGVIVAF